ncbi:hypothetical protein GUJ93_ZPchr0011g28386 [Zizania palustris]|uniref:Uncharacterized protein n=1 Tax=Zizania palustris TaxID=103762 RepID=A0A8J5WLI0_ZIZPA|nr:hypothetical protein GUJ93_ZPchr0011g28386 [Zizania palustris]
MAARNFDLNCEPQDEEINASMDWGDIDEWDGHAHELDYDMLWNDGEGICPLSMLQVFWFPSCLVAQIKIAHGEDAHGEDDGEDARGENSGEGPHADGGGSSVRKRRFYSNELKVAIYLELLAHATPLVLHHGVSKVQWLQRP